MIGEHSVVGVERQIDAERRLVDAGIVDEDVDRPDRCLRLGEQPFERLGLRQVPAHPVDRGPELGHLLDVHRGDLSALGREAFRDRAADPVRRTGHERRAPSSSVIPCPLARCRWPFRSGRLRSRGMHASRHASAASTPMRITDVEPIVLRLAQVDATRADGTQDAFLVRIHTDEGIVGVGEADTAPLLARTIDRDAVVPFGRARPARGAGRRGPAADRPPLAAPVPRERPLRASRRGAARDQRDRHRPLGHRRQGRRASPSPSCSAAAASTGSPSTRARSCPRHADDVRRIAERAVEAGYTRAQARLGPARSRPRVRRGARPRRARDARPGARPDDRRGPGLHRASAPSSCCAAWRSTASTGSRRRCSRTTSTATGASPTEPRCGSPRERPTRPAHRFARSSSMVTLDVLAAGYRPLRRVHRGPADRAAGAVIGGRDRARTASRRAS